MGRPDYRWDAEKRRGGSHSLIRACGGRNDAAVGLPDYQWKNHEKSLKVRPAPPQRTQSDLSDYKALRVGRPPKRSRKKKKASSFTTLALFDDSDSAQALDGSSQVAQEKAARKETTIIGYNWVTKKTVPLRSRSDLSSYEPKAASQRRKSSPLSKRRSKRRCVRFSEEDPEYIDLPALTEKDKAELFWTKVEILSFRSDQSNEKAELQRKKRDATCGNASASLNSFWGGKKTTSAEDKQIEKELKAKKEAAKKEWEAKKEAEMASVMEALQSAMNQASLVTGY